jgi:surface protein
MTWIKIPNSPSSATVSWEYNDSPADPNATITSGSFVVGTRYEVSDLTGTNQTQWNAAAGTSNVNYVERDESTTPITYGTTFKAVAAGAGSGKVLLADRTSRPLWLKSNLGIRGEPTAGEGINARRKVVNHIQHSEDLTNAAWVTSNMTVTSGVSDPLGGGTAYTLTATADNATWLQTVTPPLNAEGGVADGTAFSIWVRRRAGEVPNENIFLGVLFARGGNAAVMQAADGPTAAYHSLSTVPGLNEGIIYDEYADMNTVGATGWHRVFGQREIEAFTGTSTVGIKIDNDGHSYDVWHPQFEAVTKDLRAREDRPLLSAVDAVNTLPEATLSISGGTSPLVATQVQGNFNVGVEVSEYTPSGVDIYSEYTTSWLGVDYRIIARRMRVLIENASGDFGPSKLVPLRVYHEVRKIDTAATPTTTYIGELNKTYFDAVGNEDDHFKMVVATTGADETMTIPMSSSGAAPTAENSCTINWGDGTTTTVTARNSSDMSHVYASAGDYTISISGKLSNIYLPGVSGMSAKVKRVLNFGKLGFTHLDSAFKDCANLTEFTLGTFDTTELLTCESMFRDSGLVTVDMTDFINGKATTITNMFRGCSSLTSANIIGWDTRNVTKFKGLFRGCTSLTDVPGTQYLRISSFTDGETDQFENFMHTSGKMTTAQYDALLVNLRNMTASPLYRDLDPVDFGDSKYTASGDAATARGILVGNHGTTTNSFAAQYVMGKWVINDGGTA